MSALGARLLVFFASAAVLLMEILAGRLLAPYVGVSLETFTAIIGTVLAAIALGAWWGGRLADRMPPRKLLGPLLAAGGGLTLLAPTIVAALGPGFRGGRALAIVILTTLGFFAPALALSAIPPIVVKLRLASLDETGAVVGSLSAISTAGALFGTFTTGFVLLAAWPSRPIILVVGGLLVVTGLALSAGALARRTSLVLTAAAVVAGGLLLVVDGPCEYETTYVCAQVVVDSENPAGRVLVLDTVRHSYVDLDDPTHLEFRYIQLIADVIDSQVPKPDPNVLYIGGGGFTVPQWLEATRPQATHTVLELDRLLVDIAIDELGMPPDLVDEVLVGDARRTIEETPEGAFDVVVGDAFSGASVPWHLTTAEFLAIVDSRLAPGGVYVMNVIDYPPLRFVKAEVATVSARWEHVAVVAPPDYLAGERGGNFIVVASHRPLDEQALSARLADRAADSVVITGAEVAEWVGEARILTDDFAPVDQLLSRPG